jgi:hypothetical protein
MGSINSRPLKAFVRFDGSGRIVAGSLILRKNKPKVGKWKEIQAYECCSFNTTTTTSTTSTPTYTIGQSALGGKIAYILQEGDPGYNPDVQHGFVATVEDISLDAIWGCEGVNIPGASGSAIGTGNQNTIDIMDGCSTAGIAARLCGDLVNGGYNDWYLPSQDELAQLYINRIAIGNFNLSSKYWSSSEFDSTLSWYYDFDGDYLNYDNKDFNYFNVRAIRSF